MVFEDALIMRIKLKIYACFLFVKLNKRTQAAVLKKIKSDALRFAFLLWHVLFDEKTFN